MSTHTTVTIRIVETWNDLHCHYAMQTDRQDCYIELDCRTGLLHANYNAEIGNAIPFSVYHGHDQRYGIPCLNADAANTLLEEIAPLAQRVLDGYDSKWDGNNMVAIFDEDAIAADREIESLCNEITPTEGESVDEWDADTWLRDWDALDEITAATTDEELESLKTDAETMAALECVVLQGCEKFLQSKRQDAMTPQ